MNKIFIFIFIIFIHLTCSVNASVIYIKSEFDEPTRRHLYSLVDESIPTKSHAASNICDDFEYHITLKGISTPLTRTQLMMFKEEDKPERFKFENTVNKMHEIMKTFNFEITGAEILQGPRKQFLVAVIKPLLNETMYTKNDIDDVFGAGCIHVTLMKAPLSDCESQDQFNNYKSLINKYISSASLKPIAIHKTVAEVAHNQSIYRGR